MNSMQSIDQEFREKLNREFFSKKEYLIKEAVIKCGFDFTDIGFIKDNFQFITGPGRKFEDLYYKYGTPDEIKIISIEKFQNIKFEFTDHLDPYKVTGSYDYY